MLEGPPLNYTSDDDQSDDAPNSNNRDDDDLCVSSAERESSANSFSSIVGDDTILVDNEDSADDDENSSFRFSFGREAATNPQDLPASQGGELSSIAVSGGLPDPISSNLVVNLDDIRAPHFGEHHQLMTSPLERSADSHRLMSSDSTDIFREDIFSESDEPNSSLQDPGIERGGHRMSVTHKTHQSSPHSMTPAGTARASSEDDQPTVKITSQVISSEQMATPDNKNGSTDNHCVIESNPRMTKHLNKLIEQQESYHVAKEPPPGVTTLSPPRTATVTSVESPVTLVSKSVSETVVGPLPVVARPSNVAADRSAFKVSKTSKKKQAQKHHHHHHSKQQSKSSTSAGASSSVAPTTRKTVAFGSIVNATKRDLLSQQSSRNNTEAVLMPASSSSDTTAPASITFDEVCDAVGIVLKRFDLDVEQRLMNNSCNSEGSSSGIEANMSMITSKSFQTHPSSHKGDAAVGGASPDCDILDIRQVIKVDDVLKAAVQKLGEPNSSMKDAAAEFLSLVWSVAEIETSKFIIKELKSRYSHLQSVKEAALTRVSKNSHFIAELLELMRRADAQTPGDPESLMTAKQVQTAIQSRLDATDVFASAYWQLEVSIATDRAILESVNEGLTSILTACTAKLRDAQTLKAAVAEFRDKIQETERLVTYHTEICASLDEGLEFFKGQCERALSRKCLYISRLAVLTNEMEKMRAKDEELKVKVSRMMNLNAKLENLKSRISPKAEMLKLIQSLGFFTIKSLTGYHIVLEVDVFGAHVSSPNAPEQTQGCLYYCDGFRNLSNYARFLPLPHVCIQWRRLLYRTSNATVSDCDALLMRSSFDELSKLIIEEGLWVSIETAYSCAAEWNNKLVCNDHSGSSRAGAGGDLSIRQRFINLELEVRLAMKSTIERLISSRLTPLITQNLNIPQFVHSSCLLRTQEAMTCSSEEEQHHADSDITGVHGYHSLSVFDVFNQYAEDTKPPFTIRELSALCKTISWLLCSLEVVLYEYRCLATYFLENPKYTCHVESTSGYLRFKVPLLTPHVTFDDGQRLRLPCVVTFAVELERALLQACLHLGIVVESMSVSLSVPNLVAPETHSLASRVEMAVARFNKYMNEWTKTTETELTRGLAAAIQDSLSKWSTPPAEPGGEAGPQYQSSDMSIKAALGVKHRIDAMTAACQGRSHLLEVLQSAMESLSGTLTHKWSPFINKWDDDSVGHCDATQITDDVTIHALLNDNHKVCRVSQYPLFDFDEQSSSSLTTTTVNTQYPQ